MLVFKIVLIGIAGAILVMIQSNSSQNTCVTASNAAARPAT